ncbi:MAG: DUF1963 domain-containing protein [Clostridia bacterium]|nr:DUF1963 domain-containing protein [Clostridia bacterium]
MGYSRVYGNIAQLYESKKDFTSAIKYYKKAKEKGYDVDAQLARAELEKQNEEEFERMNGECVAINEAIEKFKKQTAKNCTMIVIDKECPLNDILSSKIGGVPYMPIGEDWPKDSNGDEMPLLLQVNFKEMNSKQFPNHGILEIFLDKSLGYPPEYVIKYYENIDDEYRNDIKPVDVSDFVTANSYKIVFKDAIDYMHTSDYRFEDEINKILNDIIKDKKKTDEIIKYAKLTKSRMVEEAKDDKEIVSESIIEEIYYKIENIQITMGGYPDFTQSDPRGYEKSKEHLTECLFKLDSCGEHEFYIGDSGIISVLISMEDLKSARFENAQLDWDCC